MPSAPAGARVLGVDVGAVSVSTVELGPGGEVLGARYLLHHGDVAAEAMSRVIEEKTGVPMVSVTYDGVGGGKNEVILPYLEYPRGRGGRPRSLHMA